ncbi:hypothetical protein N7478_006560 [Penicillium angulare]|uniref:uncharacterized protein n=1 Tax=Penicillium angulare TaxID=116970 RepID=UPI0025412840|nr:uncharacterized protein N7478_006560 [Penicillium angulare]KAJ5281188.1 hypothetical protein N7478_006560 [Penicillium angulare]
MNQTHTRAIEALQPFIHIANSNSATSPRFVANIITNATSHPHTYVFAELLETPTIQSLQSPDIPPEYQGYLKLLEIFAWGTWQDYQASSSSSSSSSSSAKNIKANNETYIATPNLPKLSSEQAQKLRLLSLLSLATTIKPLTYSALQSALSLPDIGDLESLVTSAIYSSLLGARLSPSSNPPTVNVTSVAPLRDVQPQSLGKMITQLTEWEARCGEVARDLEAEIEAVKANAAIRGIKETEYKEMYDVRVKARKQDAGAPGTGGGVGNAAPVARRGPLGIRRGPRGLFGGNKREADDIEQDDGFFDAGDGMDIDEGAGSGRGNGSRTKRVLGGRRD